MAALTLAAGQGALYVLPFAVQQRDLGAFAAALLLKAPDEERRFQRRVLGRSTTTRAASPCNAVVTRATLG
jgi:hypothetical protein